MSVFGHGQLRLYLLALLREGPRHGYDVIRDLEQRFSGLYSPSAGTVYPRLAKLEEEGLVERTDEGRKALYRLTDAGRAEVDARAGEIDDLEQSLDASAERLADEMRRRVQSQASELRTEMNEATARYRGTGTDRSSSYWGAATDRPAEGDADRSGGGRAGGFGGFGATGNAPAFDLDGLLGGLTRGHVPDSEDIARALRRWGLGASSTRRNADVTNVTPGADDVHSTPTEASSSNTAGPATRETVSDPAGDDDVPDAIVIHPVTGVPTEPVDEPETHAVPGQQTSESSGGQRDRRQDKTFPSAEQVREVVEILKDAGERIQRVLDRPRG